MNEMQNHKIDKIKFRISWFIRYVIKKQMAAKKDRIIAIF